MHGVGHQRQRVCGVAERELRDHEAGVEGRTDRERKAEIIRRMAVAGVVVRMGVIVMMMVVRHGGRYSALKWEYYYNEEMTVTPPSLRRPDESRDP